MSYFYRQMEASREEGIAIGIAQTRARFAEALEQERARTAEALEQDRWRYLRETTGRLLTRRFGPLSPEDEAALSAASIDALKAVPDEIFTAPTAAALLRAIGA